MTTRENGTIYKLTPERKFGFVQVHGSRETLFFHANDLDGLSFEDDELMQLEVTFDVVADRKHPDKYRATAIRRLH